MVFYRKYRPQTLDELAGQETVKQTLKSAAAAGTLSHAYLFCGPRGVGKTSAARILAKIVNCSAKQDIPCNKCEICTSITDGSNLDVIEMDAASNRGIEDIRLLRENIKLAPTSAKKKVYIIDEVHMLSNDAFNALLKTLEEPPSHVLFILATTEAQKIPATILSRATRLDFKLVSEEDLVKVLACIAEKEKVSIDQEALLALARLSGGSVRDAQKFLDQLSAYKKIDIKIVEKNLGVGAFEETVKLLESIARGELSDALLLLTRQAETGTASKELALSILETLRQLLLIKNGLGEVLVRLQSGELKYKKLSDLATLFELDRLLFVIGCFQKSLEEGRFVSIPTLPLEVAVALSCQDQRLKCKVSSKEREVAHEKSAEGEKVVVEKLSELAKNDHSSLDIDNSSDITKIQERWVYILETVRQYNYSLEALLRSAKILACSEKSVVIQVPYTFHQRILETPKSRDLLQSILSDILGRSVGVSTVLGARPVRSEEIANVEVAADDEIVRIASEIFSAEPN